MTTAPYERHALRRLATAGTVFVLLAASACGVVGPMHQGPVSSAVVASIPLSDYGADVAVRADGAQAYVPLRTNQVVVIDTANRRVASTINTGGQPYAIALTHDGTRAYVVDMTAQNIFALDTMNDRLLTRIPVGIIARPILSPAAAVSPDGRFAYATEATVNEDHILVVDAATNTIVGDHFLRIHPAGVAVSPDGRTVYVVGCRLSCMNGTFLALDAASWNVVSEIPLTSVPAGLLLAPDGSRAYVPNGLAATVAAIDLATKTVSAIPVDPQPTGVAVSPRGGFVYVTSFGAASVNVIDTHLNAVVRKIAVNSSPRAIAVSPDGQFAYVTHTSSCSVIDLRRVTNTSGT